MPSYTIPENASGLLVRNQGPSGLLTHSFGVRTHKTPTSGSLLIEGRRSGSDIFEQIATVNLTAITDFDVTKAVAEWRFTANNADCNLIYVTHSDSTMPRQAEGPFTLNVETE